ncbi:hypothetical protein H7X87_03855 [Acetobacteraceae bacterium]|nr:hypothetical protein [Candidatus Parcubacteria bacterium]
MALIFNALALFFAVLTAGIYWYGVEQSFFWIYDWYDSMLHVLGGITIGFWASAVALRLQLPVRRAFFTVLGLTLLGAVAWEIFEYAFHFVRQEDYILDTLTDIMNGLAGCVLAFSGLWFVLLREKTHGE